MVPLRCVFNVVVHAFDCSCEGDGDCRGNVECWPGGDWSAKFRDNRWSQLPGGGESGVNSKRVDSWGGCHGDVVGMWTGLHFLVRGWVLFANRATATRSEIGWAATTKKWERTAELVDGKTVEL